jgi:hypothetical protein
MVLERLQTISGCEMKKLLMLLLAASGLMAQTPLNVTELRHEGEKEVTGSRGGCQTQAPLPGTGLPTQTNCHSRNTTIITVREIVLGDDGKTYTIE